MFNTAIFRICRGAVRLLAAGLAWVALGTLGGCSSMRSAPGGVATMISPYKVDVVQGNFVSREQVAAVKPGMGRQQVRNILGSPLLTSVFHADRWDYVFTLRRQAGVEQPRRVTVYFKADVMDRLEADELPSEAEFVASLSSRLRMGEVPVLQASEEELQKFPAPAPRVAPALPDLPDSYPPLESSVR